MDHATSILQMTKLKPGASHPSNLKPGRSKIITHTFRPLSLYPSPFIPKALQVEPETQTGLPGQGQPGQRRVPAFQGFSSERAPDVGVLSSALTRISNRNLEQ